MLSLTERFPDNQGQPGYKSHLKIFQSSVYFHQRDHLFTPYGIFVVSVQGIRDLFWLPVEQYRKDGRIIRGIQRGANSFTKSTVMATLELTNRMVQSVQVGELLHESQNSSNSEVFLSGRGITRPIKE
jgi:hypothetical protein